MILGLTGGIASGKSTFRRALLDLRRFESFDADRCVHDLLAADRDVAAAVRAEFGEAVVAPGGGIDRAALRPLAFASPAARQRLESILHPRVRTRWRAMVSECRAAGTDLVCDIPLLFETRAEGFFDSTVTVAASPAVQWARLRARGLDDNTITSMLASQWTMSEKMALATHVVWNDGDLSALRRQAGFLLEVLPS